MMQNDWTDARSTRLRRRLRARDDAAAGACRTAEYRIGKEDVVAVEVWKDPALSAKVPVRPDGKISLPMIGDITAEGRTAKELQKEITDQAARRW